jgi:tetratricopeptide (TPR) repeat protein
MSSAPTNSDSEDAAAAERLAERLAEASTLAEQEDWPAAYELLLEEESRFPEDPTLLCMLGVAARESGTSGAAYDYFRRCIAHEPSDPVILATAGSGIAAWDDPDAERVLRLGALLAPEMAITRLSYGSYLAREGMWESAVVELEAARDLEVGDAAIRFELGVAYLLAGRSDPAIAELAEATVLESEDSWLQAIYGLALADVDRVDEAAEQLHAASLERTDDWEIQLAAALAAAAEEWWDHAWAALARAELVTGADDALIREVEERLETGAEASRRFLKEELAAPALHTRLLARD